MQFNFHTFSRGNVKRNNKKCEITCNVHVYSTLYLSRSNIVVCCDNNTTWILFYFPCRFRYEFFFSPEFYNFFALLFLLFNFYCFIFIATFYFLTLSTCANVHITIIKKKNKEECSSAMYGPCKTWSIISLLDVATASSHEHVHSFGAG